MGKGTQAQLLVGRGRDAGLKCTLFSFPRYGTNPFSEAVARYLNGEFGSTREVPPEFSSLLYAGDRFAVRAELIQALATDDLVVCDRYVASNLAHHGAKLEAAAREAFVAWLSEIEFELYELPRPAVTVLLDAPVSVARSLVASKADRGYTKLSHDIHESDLEYLAVCRDLFMTLASQNERTWRVVPIVSPSGRTRTKLEIARDVIAAVIDVVPSLGLARSVA